MTGAMTGPRTIEDAWRAGTSAGNNFDAIRLFAAALVIFSHSFEVSGGGRATEPFEIISGQISFGELAVLIFFALSGFLIAKSWAARPQLSVFMRNRVLRITPALFVSVALLVFIAGPLLTTMRPGAYFADPGASCFLLNAIFISGCSALPGVFDGAPANAPLWTLGFEALCYGLIATLGVSRILGAYACAALALIVIAVGTFGAATGWGGGFLYKLSVLVPPFLVGSAMALFAGRIPLDARLAGVSALALVISVFTGTLVASFAFFGVYLVLWAGFARFGAALTRVGARGDFSYGLYIWGWPVQHVVAQTAGGPPLVNFLLSLPIAFAFAVLSWRFVEHPALRLKTVLSPASGAKRGLNFRNPAGSAPKALPASPEAVIRIQNHD